MAAGFTVAKEYCGYAQRRWVLRHYGCFVSSHSTRSEVPKHRRPRGRRSS